MVGGPERAGPVNGHRAVRAGLVTDAPVGVLNLAAVEDVQRAGAVLPDDQKEAVGPTRARTLDGRSARRAGGITDVGPGIRNRATVLDVECAGAHVPHGNQIEGGRCAGAVDGDGPAAADHDISGRLRRPRQYRQVVGGVRVAVRVPVVGGKPVVGSGAAVPGEVHGRGDRGKDGASDQQNGRPCDRNSPFCFTHRLPSSTKYRRRDRIAPWPTQGRAPIVP